jgi:hypothetical protein
VLIQSQEVEPERVIDDIMWLLKIVKRNRRQEDGTRPVWAMFPFRSYVEEGIMEQLENKNRAESPPSTRDLQVR